MSGDPFVRTARQEQFVRLAAELAGEFAETAAVHDRENTFPYDHFVRIRESGYSRLTVPEAFGGEGASLTETLLAQERLAQGDGATALAVGWHLATVGKLVDTQAWPSPILERILREVAVDGALINSAASEVSTGSPSRGGRPTTEARPCKGGWVLSGRKAFTSLAPVLDYAIVSAGLQGEEGGGWFLVPMDTPGVAVDETWDSLAMRATGSQDLVLEEVTLPLEALVEPFGQGKTDQMGKGAGAAWALHIPATYLGIARAARDFALRFARERRPNTLKGPIADLPHIQALLGESEADLLAARSTLYTVAERWEKEPDRRPELVPLLGAAKVVAVNAAVRIVDRAMRVAGIAGLSRNLPLERYYRDVRAGFSNPPMEDAVFAGLARAALKESEAAELVSSREEA